MLCFATQTIDVTPSRCYTVRKRSFRVSGFPNSPFAFSGSVHCHAPSPFFPFAALSGVMTVQLMPSSMAADRQRLGEKEAIVALEMISTHIESNVSQMNTWRGVVDCQDEFAFPEKPTRELNTTGRTEAIRAQVEFTVDRHMNAARVVYRSDTPIVVRQIGDSVHGETAMDQPIELHWIMTPAEFIEFDAIGRRGQIEGFPDATWLPSKGTRVVSRAPPGESDGIANVFDPRMEFFGNGSVFFGEQCRRYASMLSGKVGEEEQRSAQQKLVVERMDLAEVVKYFVTVTFADTPTGPSLATTEYDSTVGFNAVNWTRERGGRIIGSRHVEYHDNNGVFVPSRVEVKRFSSDGRDVVPRVHRIANLVGSEINVDVPPSRFQLQDLPLGYGDRVYDRMVDRIYVFNGDSVIPVDDFVFDSTLANPRKVGASVLRPDKVLWTSRFVIVVNLTAIAVVIGLILYRRYWPGARQSENNTDNE